ncbi:MAG TPA: sn-glycerol-3-phosphate import ATP-binding protein UgpC [Paenalcaligenes sp.]|nr:sn-glycerol-3-phosphate import ATP-binding protein UgpC [Paenalcaligenes sp.]
MAAVVLDKVGKIYPGDIEVIKDFSMAIEAGEFVVIVGPSGCGKSTLLRMVAGLEVITSGAIHIAGNQVNNLEPAQRDIAMVFQNYALYPHMKVFDNMAYGLKIKKFPKEEIEDRVQNAAKILELSHLLDRRPRELSGGQRQRVAMGRAIVREPKVFLFDEPLSNLDAKLRVQMRLEIQRLHQRLRTTSLYVTHDQVEAMTLAQRMVVMNKGVAEQIGTPDEVFNTPASTFVASFIGSPPMNLLPVQINDNKQIIADNGQTLQFEPHLIPDALKNKSVIMGVRPEHFKLHQSGIEVDIEMVEVLGSEQLIHARLGDYPIVVRCPTEETARYPLELDEAIQIGLNPGHPLHWFDKETQRRLEFD